MKNERIIEITNTLKELGVSPMLKGYAYLREAIGLVMDNPDLLNRSITKILYPTIAKTYKTTTPRVERGIRFAIERAYDRANISFMKEVFNYTISSYKGKATNGEFIATVADYLMLNEQN